MAKQAVNAFERHVEKGVLGVSALLLFASVGLYLVRSPNTVEIQNQQVGPGEADVQKHRENENEPGKQRMRQRTGGLGPGGR